MHVRRTALVSLSLSTVVAFGALAHAEDGVWIGRETGAFDNVVVLEKRGNTVMLSDQSGVAISQATFTVVGPGGKGGELNYDVDLQTAIATTRAGLAITTQPKGTKQLARWREDTEAGTIRFCMSSGPKVVRPPRANEVIKGVRCFELQRARVPAPPAAVAPGPTCMRECRQANMMRAVSPEAIDEDCRRICATSED